MLITNGGGHKSISSRAINDLNDYFSVAGIASGFGAGEALGKFLAKKGVGLAAKFLGQYHYLEEQ